MPPVNCLEIKGALQALFPASYCELQLQEIASRKNANHMHWQNQYKYLVVNTSTVKSL